MKKALSILLATMLLLTIFPMSTLGVSAGPGDTTMNEIESNNYMSLADRIYNDYTVNGVVSGNDMDYFKFTLSSRSTISIITLATYKSCFIGGVFTPSEVAVAASSFVEYSDSGYPSYLTIATLDAGTYYYVVFNKDGSSLRNTYMFHFSYTPVSTGHVHYYSYACDPTCDGCAYTRDVTHTYDSACDSVCNVCDEERTPSAPHSYVAECAAHCYECGNLRIPVASHTYTDDCAVSCDACGDTREAPHVYDNACDGTCNGCGFIRTIPHSYQAATCTTPKTCKLCGVTEGEKLGHTYKKVVVTKATTSKNGKYKNVCEACGYVASKQPTIYKVGKVSLSKTSYTYNGKVQKPSVVVKDSNGKTISSAHYTVKYASGLKSAGTYKVTITFKGNYSGTKTLTYKINPISVSKCKITLSKTSCTYNGKAQKPSVTVKNANGTKLSTSSYTVTYASGRKTVGTYKVTVKMKGNYTGTKTLTFKVIPAKTSLSKLTADKKSIKVTYAKKSTQVTGYQIQYSTSKSFKSYKTKTISNYKTTSTTLTGLKAKTIYYVRVRTYKTVGKTKYYSAWSSVKTLCTKHTHAYVRSACKYCKQPNPKYKTYGDSIRYKDDRDDTDFTLTFGSKYTFATEKYGDGVFVRIPVTVKNNDSVTSELDWCNFDLSSSNNVTQYDGYSSIIVSRNRFDDGRVIFSKVRPKSSVTGAVYIPYTGSGYYAIMLDNLDDVVIEFYVK